MSSFETVDLDAIVSLLNCELPDWSEELRAGGGMVTFCNPLAVRLCRKDKSWRHSLGRFRYVFPDGILLARVASLLRGVRVPRRSFDGNSIAPMVFRACRELRLGVILVGGREGVASQAAKVISSAFDYPDVMGVSGYFSSQSERSGCIEYISNLQRTLVVCGMGSPLQENFLIDLSDAGFNGWAFTCGGYLDQVCERGHQYYPEFIERFHLRAPFRIANEPFRLLPRYTLGYSAFYTQAVRAIGAQKLGFGLDESMHNEVGREQ